MNTLLADCELVVVVLLTMCLAVLVEPLLFLAMLKAMQFGMRRLGPEPSEDELAAGMERFKRTTRA